MSKIIKLPDIGEGIDSVEVSEVSIKPGDSITADDTVLVVETEKASMEIPASDSGTVAEVLVKPGDILAPGAVLFTLKAEEGKTDSLANSGGERKKEQAGSSELRGASDEKPITSDELPMTGDQSPIMSDEVRGAINEQPVTNDQRPVRKVVSASPSVRRFARELGCDLGWVSGTGPKGRITKEDVKGYIKGRLSKQQSGAPASGYTFPSIDFSKFGKTETVPLNKIRKVSGQRLQAAWNQIPHVTQFDRADITELDDFRVELNSARRSGSPKMSYLPFMMKALVPIFREYPDFCASLDSTGKNLILKKYIHIGIAVDTPNGLIVPVVRDVDKKSVPEIMAELTDISGRARGKKIKPDELQGGCFTISSLGGISGTAFTPIVNPPEVAILGISRTSVEPVFLDKEFVPRVLVPVSLSYDHRVIDGAVAARFTKLYCSLLSDFKTIPDLNIY